MAVPFRAVLRSGVVVFAGLGAGTAFLIMGIAGVALRAQCPEGTAGLGSCLEAPIDPVVTGSTEPEFNTETVMAIKRPQAAFDPAPVSGRETDLARADGMIASTFALLVNPRAISTAAPNAESPAQAPAAAEAPAGAEPIVVASAEDVASTTVAKRVVRSIKVNARGDPVWPASAYAEAMDRVDVASTAAAAIAAEVPVEDSAAAAVAAVEPLALTEAAPEPQVAAEPDKHLARVSGGPTNVRSGPSRSHGKLFTLAKGAEVEALAATSGWVRIADNEGRAGWIFGEFLEGLDLASLPASPPEDIEVAAVASAPEPAPARAEPAPQQAASSDTRTVKGQGVNVRSGPSSSNGKLFALTAGTKVSVVDTQRGWLKITDPKGRTGWAYSTYLN
jgi:uncharacterized protein YgiM (DUF1202 family)